MTPEQNAEVCEDYLTIGRGNDYIEGYDKIIYAGKDLALEFTKATPPKAKSQAEARVLAKDEVILAEKRDFTRFKTEVLSDKEPNGADLSQVDSYVSIRKEIYLELLKNAQILFGFLSYAVCLLLVVN